MIIVKCGTYAVGVNVPFADRSCQYMHWFVEVAWENMHTDDDVELKRKHDCKRKFSLLIN